jgi:hypothetical protein
MMFTRKFLLAAVTLAISAAVGNSQQLARGVVFEDLNRNGLRDRGELGIEGVRVSNQRDVVVTDANGRWELPSSEDVIFFVVKPSGWMTPVNSHQLPRFYYIHKPGGSPANLKFPGVTPTGPLPASIDFPLHRAVEPESFKVVFFGDPQPRDVKEVDYIKHDVIEDLVGTDARFGVTLGDIVFDDLSVFEPLNAAIALIGIPWYNVLGNHDINYDVPNDRLSDETFERLYGPNYYSFDYGPVHFVVLDDVNWEGAKPEGSGKYSAGFDEQQLAFLANDLVHVPQDQLVVLSMHIPLTAVTNREAIYRLIENRPYTISFSAHTHNQTHRFITKADGWNGAEPHQHVINVTVCGSWWSGVPNEVGIPHATMSDGAPNGYSIVSFNKNLRPIIDFKAARRPESYQMNIHAPEEVTISEAFNTTVYVNVFAGNERTAVRMRLGGVGAWVQLLKTDEPDPYFVKQKKMEEEFQLPGRKLPNPANSSHLWKGKLPANLKAGTQFIEIEATDMYGRIHRDQRIIAVK